MTVGQSYTYGVGTTTEIIEAIFLDQYGMYSPMLGDLTEQKSMADGQSHTKLYAEIDPPPPPQEVVDGMPPALVQMGSRVFQVKPTRYGLSLVLGYDEQADSSLDEAAWAARGIATRMAYWPEREMMRLVLNPLNPTSATFTGGDGQNFFSTAHDFAVTNRVPGVPAPTRAGATTWSNVTTGTGGGANNIYSATSQAQADFRSARSAILSRTDAHGEPLVIEQPGGRWIAMCNTLEPTTAQYLDLAFHESARPGDDSNRDVIQFNVELVQNPLMNGIGGTITVTEYADWMLFYMAPGARPPLFILERRALTSAHKADDVTRTNTWAWDQRHGAGYNDAFAAQFINAN